MLQECCWFNLWMGQNLLLPYAWKHAKNSWKWCLVPQLSFQPFFSCTYLWLTIPDTNGSPLKIDLWKRRIPIGHPPVFGGGRNLSFRDGMSLYGFKEITFSGVGKRSFKLFLHLFRCDVYTGKPPKNPLKTDLCFRLNQSFSSSTCFFHEFFSKLKDFWEYSWGAALFVETMFQLDGLFIIAWIWVQPCPMMQSKNNLFHVICLMNLHFPLLVVQGYTQNMYTPNSPELWNNLCPFSLFCIIFKIKKQWFLNCAMTLKRNMVSLFLDDSKSWPLKTHIGEPKKWRFGVGDFPFLSGQPAGAFRGEARDMDPTVRLLFALAMRSCRAHDGPMDHLNHQRVYPKMWQTHLSTHTHTHTLGPGVLNHNHLTSAARKPYLQKLAQIAPNQEMNYLSIIDFHG